MTFAANGDNLILGRGALLLDKYVSGVRTGLRFVGNVPSLTLSTSDETIDKYSSTEAASPLLKRVTTRRTVELVATLEEFDIENLALMMMGEVVNANQSSATSQNIVFTDVAKGRWYDVGARNITNVAVTVGGNAKALNTDYQLDAANGLIFIMNTGTIVALDDVSVTFDRPAATITKIRGAKYNSIQAYVVFQSDNASGPNYRLEAWKCNVIPDGELGFISDEFGSFNIRMTIEADATNHPNEPYYQLTKVG